MANSNPTPQILPLTRENLDLLLQQYETQLEKLDPIHNSEHRHVCFYWSGPRNRFYDVRTDNHYYNKNLNKFYRHKWTRIEDIVEGNESSECTCKLCEGEIDECSEDTMDSIDFAHRACPEDFSYTELKDKCTLKIVKDPEFKVLYENRPKTDFDGIPDPYKLRIKGPTQQGEIRVLNLNSIPIIERNLVRLNKELVRQEAFKWTMAFIRVKRLVKSRLSVWSVLNQDNILVQIYLPREIVIQIVFWLKF